jgi:acyl-CoA thioesterase-1
MPTRTLKFIAAALACLVLAGTPLAQEPARKISERADAKTYLSALVDLLSTRWPKNRTVNIVCHGHSVPAGYFKTPLVDTFNAYPHLLHRGIKERFPYAVVNVIVTAIGGEDSETGAKRFERDVLAHQPDVVTIDYALNDRRIGLERARKAWASMIEQAKAKGVKVILLTPTADLAAKLDDPADPLNQHAEQIRYGVGLVDSYAAFKTYVQAGGRLDELMAQVNHPNAKGHGLVATELLKWFAAAK